MNCKHCGLGKILHSETLHCQNLAAGAGYLDSTFEEEIDERVLDMFASMAMISLIRNQTGLVISDNNREIIARSSYKMAVTMLEVRKDFIK